MTEIRRAGPADVEGVAELLSLAYARPRSFFAARMVAGLGWAPEQSWVAIERGRPVAHVRAFERAMRLGPAVVSIAAIGYVGTAPDARGRGHAARVLRAALDAARAAGSPYALLWSRAGRLYVRERFVTIPYPRVRIRAAPTAGAVRAFGPGDLADVVRLQARTGPVERTDGDWALQLRHGPAHSRFLIARDTDGGLLGFVRAQPGRDATQLLDLAVEPGRPSSVGPLLAAAGSDGLPVEGPLPRSLRAALPDRAVTPLAPGADLMGRTLDRDALARAVGGPMGDLDEHAVARHLARDLVAWPADAF